MREGYDDGDEAAAPVPRRAGGDRGVPVPGRGGAERRDDRRRAGAGDRLRPADRRRHGAARDAAGEARRRLRDRRPEPLPHAIGGARTRELFLTGRRIDAATAERWGLVNEVVEAEALPAPRWRSRPRSPPTRRCRCAATRRGSASSSPPAARSTRPSPPRSTPSAAPRSSPRTCARACGPSARSARRCGGGADGARRSDGTPPPGGPAASVRRRERDRWCVTLSPCAPRPEPSGCGPIVTRSCLGGCRPHAAVDHS